MCFEIKPPDELRGKGNYKNGKKEGEWVEYYHNGQLFWKGTYRNGKKEGLWVFYYKDGTKDPTGEDAHFHQGSGIYKNGVKVSD